MHGQNRREVEGIIKRNKQRIEIQQQEDDLLPLLLNKTIDEETYKRSRDKFREELSKLLFEIDRVQRDMSKEFELQADFVLELCKDAKLL